MVSDKIPYLTIAITNACNFRCYYCSPDGNGGYGEAFGTKSRKIDIQDLEEKIRIAESQGITKVRITGGEPLIMDGTLDLLKFLEKQTDLDYSLATNGSLVHRFVDDFKHLSRLDLRISLDTLEQKKFLKTCGSNAYFTIINNIRGLAQERILKRIGTVVTKENINEISNIMDFCEKLRINVKFFDMYSTPETTNIWRYVYSPMNLVRKIVEERGVEVRQVEYTRNFGIPCFEYKLKSGICVRIKDSTSGTRYSQELCGECNRLPCQEGLYTIMYSSDAKLIPCRLSWIKFSAETVQQFGENIKKLINIFQNSYHENKFWSGRL